MKYLINFVETYILVFEVLFAFSVVFLFRPTTAHKILGEGEEV